MEKSTRRLFIGNVTNQISESDLQKAFSRFGQIENIELKQKANLVDPENPIYFAFITILTDEFSLNKCLNRFSEKDLNGLFLNVSLAKESFLDKLKKEREEAKNEPFTTQIGKENGFHRNKVRGNKQNFSTNDIGKRKVFDSDDEVFQEDLNGRKSLNNDFNHQSETEETIPANDNERRIHSLKKMHETYTHKKMLIQQSLAGLGTHKSKKIKFDFDESEEEATNEDLSAKLDLFQNDDSSENESNKDLILHKKKLNTVPDENILKMRTKFNSDPRFNMNKSFLDTEINNLESTSSEAVEEKTENCEMEEEKASQLRIMEEIVGHKLTRPVDPNRKVFPQTVMRYDPENEEHQEIINSINKSKKCRLSCKEIDLNVEKPQQKVNKKEIEVSKDQFYTINDDLKNSLKRRGDGFSLLSMFGRKEEENDAEIKYPGEEKILIKNSNKQILDVQENPFKFDSSDSEDNLQPEEIGKETISNVLTKKKIENGKTLKSGTWVENFFIFDGDKRLKEGVEFFKSRKQEINDKNDEKEDYSKVKEQLRQIINKKIFKSKKSLDGKHKFKIKGKFKRIKK